MKKIVLASVLASSLLIGAEYNYEIAPMVGYVDPISKMNLQDHKMFGIGAYKNMNDDYILDKLELALLRGNDANYADDISKKSDTNIAMLNAINEYKLNNRFGLYMLAGLGYHQIENEQFGDGSEGFADAGVGAKLKLAKRLALRLDARYMLRFDGSTNFLYTLGLAIGLGEKAVKATPVKATPVEHIPIVKAAPVEVAPVEAISSLAPKDSDSDGVIDANDKCQNSTAGVKVDKDGCEIIITPVNLGIEFDTDSAKIKSTDLAKFEKFVAYAKKMEGKDIIIEAHTDDIGSEKYNKGLSYRRAMSVKKQLVKMGIDADRITTIGYGETQPKVANTSAENRQINRRVEWKIVH